MVYNIYFFQGQIALQGCGPHWSNSGISNLCLLNLKESGSKNDAARGFQTSPCARHADWRRSD